MAKGNRDDDLDLDRLWELCLKALTFVSSIGLWIMSIYFSAEGFGFMAGTKFTWMGYPIAVFLVTVPEILFNNGKHTANKTLMFVSILAYSWGILSNVLGLWQAFGMINPFDTGINAILAWASLIGAAILGIALEIAPEALLNIALGLEGDGRDFVSQLFIQINGEGRSYRPSYSNNNNRPNQGKGNLNIPGVTRGLGFQPPTKPQTPAGLNVRDALKSVANICPRCGNKNVAEHDGRLECPECSWHG